MKPKQWLFENGHIDNPNQRGRLSLEHKQLIEDAVRAGTAIEGYAVTNKAEGKPDAKIPIVPKVEKVSVSTDRIADVPDEIRPESDWQAYTSEGEVGMREVCNTCQSSFTYCPCQHPLYNIDFDREGVVFFKPRTEPIKRWW